MATPTPTTIAVRAPSKYVSSSSPPAFAAPPVTWLYATWSVTHSTLKMWRSAQNVRITYSALPAAPSSSSASASGATLRIDDLVEYESNKPGKTGLKTVAGVDTADAEFPGAWDWRGKGMLFFVSSHWEVLGWGERRLPGGEEVERWAVTWFAKTLFTQEGLDIYCDRRGGMSPETYAEIMTALQGIEGLADMLKEMKEVDIKLPWQEK